MHNLDEDNIEELDKDHRLSSGTQHSIHDHRRIALTVLLDVPQDVVIMNEEIFGPLLPIFVIAVKRLKVRSNKAEMEFVVEVEILGRARHKNLLSLCGYRAEGKERLIVYDYMPNFSLLTHLHEHHSTECQLDWSRRMKIAIGSAEGIAYFHHHATPHIIQRDIKASNVLLDLDFQAKVANFGFAKLVPYGAIHVTTKVKGTLGYLALKYAMLGHASESCDVYSFGKVLELATRKKPVEKLSPTLKRTSTE